METTGQTSPYTFSRPPIPFWQAIPNGLQLEKLIEVRGTIPYGADIFQINFTNGQDSGKHQVDRLLHLSVRFAERHVIRNALFGGQWGSEEKSGGFPFNSGKSFVILILVDAEGYKIAVDGEHRWLFKHRSTFNNANTINIDGSVRIDEVKFYDKYLVGQNIGTCMPQIPGMLGETLTNPSVPFLHFIPGGIRRGMAFNIEGRPFASVNRFTVNLQCNCSPYPTPDIALHFDVRFYNFTIVRNSRTNDHYGNEEVQIPFFPFQPASAFNLTIDVENDKFRISVDRKQFIEYRHRIQPLSKIDYLSIDHDVILTSVRISAL